MTDRPDEHEPDTTTVSPAGDSQSDPGLDSGESTDWASEGGAVPDGPATDTEPTDEADQP